MVPWLARCSLGGVHGLLRRLGVVYVYKRGRRYVHSPDPDYEAKLAALAQARAHAAADPAHVVVLYEDDHTYYRRPTVAHGYAPRGHAQPSARQGYGATQRRRVAACLDAATGRVVFWQRAHFDVRTLGRFFQAVAAAYPAAQRIYIALDNWPVHFHPTVQAALPASMVFLPLPTYAPWTNPAEKLWRWLYAEVLHSHAFTDHWPALGDAVATRLPPGSPSGPTAVPPCSATSAFGAINF